MGFVGFIGELFKGRSEQETEPVVAEDSRETDADGDAEEVETTERVAYNEHIGEYIEKVGGDVVAEEGIAVEEESGQTQLEIELEEAQEETQDTGDAEEKQTPQLNDDWGEVFKGKDGQWYVNIVSSNGKVILSSEGYTRSSGAYYLAETRVVDYKLRGYKVYKQKPVIKDQRREKPVREVKYEDLV